MGREIRLFKSEERKSRGEVAEFLRQIAGKLDAGEVILRRGAEELQLQLPGSLILEIQVEDEDKQSRGIQRSLEIEIKWFDGDEGEGSGALELG